MNNNAPSISKLSHRNDLNLTVLGRSNKLLTQLGVLSRESLIGLNMQSIFCPHLVYVEAVEVYFG